MKPPAAKAMQPLAQFCTGAFTATAALAALSLIGHAAVWLTAAL